MADAAISFAVEKLGDALIQKVKFLKGVEEDVRWVKDELRSMQSFLKDAAEKQGHDERIQQWIREVREVAQDAEDTIEIFTLKVDVPLSTRKRDLVRKWAGYPVHAFHLNRVGKELQSIRNRVDEIGKRRERYGIRNLGEVGMETPSTRPHEMVEWRRRIAARYQKEKDVVGLNEDADTLLKRVILDEETKGLSLALIVGMGGIGKSTLAGKIYNSPAIAAQFQQRAWVVVSSEFSAEDIMKQIMQQLPLSEEMQNTHMDRLKEVETVQEKLRRQEMLQEMLRQRLRGKSYLIVLDDVWESTHWDDALKYAFPDDQDKASRLIMTSRNQIVSEHHAYIHKMKLLNEDESWELLLKTAFLGKNYVRCPAEFEDIGKQILLKCHGLPLAITVTGGLLVNQGELENGWRRVLRQIKDYHLETSKIGSDVSAILELSYHNLPSQLKLCFLCLSFFKEDAVIPVKRLVHIWAALSFVQVPKDGEETVEDVAACCLDELIKRNLILVKDMGIDDQAKNCHVHDLIRELSIRKAKEDIGFESVVNCEGIEGCSSYGKSRHRVVESSGERLIQIDWLKQNKQIRSIFLHGADLDNVYLNTPSYWNRFELLRLLDIEVSILRRLPSTVRSLIGIRYLRLRSRARLMLPRWLDDLKNLEVIDLAECDVKLPNVTWKMDNLRHFYIGYSSIWPKSMKISNWKNLEKLKYINITSFESEKLIQGFRGRKLGVVIDYEYYTPNQLRVEEMGTLLAECAVQELYLKLSYKDSISGYTFPNINSLHHLTKLKLRGHMERCLSADKFPQNITHLTLSESEMSDDPMEELGKLPKLLILKLDNALQDSKNSLKVSETGFPRLKVLHLRNMPELHRVEVEEGGMPELQQLQIYDCPFIRHWTLESLIKTPDVDLMKSPSSC